MNDFMNELDSAFSEIIDLIFHSPLFEFLIVIPLISGIFSVIIRCIHSYDYSFPLPSFLSYDSHIKKYDEEIRSLLCTSPKETIDLLFEADKEYLVEYFTEHLSDFYDDLLDNDDDE